MSRQRAQGARTDTSRADMGLRLLQGLLALWLLVSPVVLPGPNAFVALKDVLAGGVLLTLTVAAAAASQVRRVESGVCVLLGVLLIVASVLLEYGPAAAAPARQWSQVVVGVLLVCLGTARVR